MNGSKTFSTLRVPKDFLRKLILPELKMGFRFSVLCLILLAFSSCENRTPIGDEHLVNNPRISVTKESNSLMIKKDNVLFYEVDVEDTSAYCLITDTSWYSMKLNEGKVILNRYNGHLRKVMILNENFKIEELRYYHGDRPSFYRVVFGADAGKVNQNKLFMENIDTSLILKPLMEIIKSDEKVTIVFESTTFPVTGMFCSYPSDNMDIKYDYVGDEITIQGDMKKTQEDFIIKLVSIGDGKHVPQREFVYNISLQGKN